VKFGGNLWIEGQCLQAKHGQTEKGCPENVPFNQLTGTSKNGWCWPWEESMAA
jgi:hypothetical protein